MLALTTLVDRLKAQVPALKRVAGVADLVAAKGSFTAFPAAYVIPERESASPNALHGVHDQQIVEAFTVLHLVKNAKDATGLAAQGDLKALVDATRAALKGWQPTVNHTPADLVQGGPLELTDQILYWPETYQTTTYLRS